MLNIIILVIAVMSNFIEMEFTQRIKNNLK